MIDNNSGKEQMKLSGGRKKDVTSDVTSD